MKKIPMLKFSTFILLVSLLTSNATCQDKIVRGVVTVFENFPLENAVIKVRSSRQVLHSDTSGGFNVSCKPGDVLYISANGFYKQIVRIDKNVKFVAVNLKPEPRGDRNINATGYGSYIVGEEKTGAISGLNNDDFDFSMFNNIYDLIEGRFAGVTVSNGEILMRGTKSLNSSNAALIVIDDLISDYRTLESLPLNIIQSIDISSKTVLVLQFMAAAGQTVLSLFKQKKGRNDNLCFPQIPQNFAETDIAVNLQNPRKTLPFVQKESLIQLM